MEKKRVLLIGSGGREHAIAWKLSQSPHVGEIVALPGNPGIEAVAVCRSIGVGDFDQIMETAREFKPDLVVVGPENPIADGLTDLLRAEGFLTFGPSQEAGRIESEKSFSKDFLDRNNIPTARSRTFTDAQREEAISWVENHPLPVVIKTDGLAAGKGVIIAESHDDAAQAVADMLDGSSFGEAGRTIVVEEFMEGEETSIFAVTDGTDYMLFESSQDHKRVGDGDVGPNTGGMGTYAPAPVVTPAVLERIEREVIEPTIRRMREEGRPYVGCLYAGLMIGADGAPRVVEFNCRFGDPETQVILPIWKGDLYELFEAAASGSVGQFNDPGSEGSAVCVVLASGGYPGSYEKGVPIEGLDSVAAEEGVMVLHAGTAHDHGEIVTAGGRVLGVVAYSDDADMERQIARAYEGVEMIAFRDMIFRTDIGKRAIGRNQE